MAYQAHAFARLNAQAEVVEERLRMRTVAEGDAVEEHLTLANADRLCIWTICYA